MSFPRHVGQLPIYYNHKKTGRGDYPGNNFVVWSHFNDVPNTPLYPFGFGLSYTSFAYSDLKLDKATISKEENIAVSINLRNTGKMTGTETVQLYIQDLVGSVTRPVKELKGFQQVTLQPGESREVTFSISVKDLAFFTAAGRWEAETGAFKVYVGANSAELKEAEFRLK